MNKANFGQAIEELKAGRRCYRNAWFGDGIFIELQKPDENSKMTRPYIFVGAPETQITKKIDPKSRTPWQPSQEDMLAEDWLSDRVY